MNIIKADIRQHKEEILAFWKRASPYDTGLEEKFAWMYENNPAGAAHVWLAIDDQSELVGMSVLFPRRFRVEGSIFIGGIMGDLLVDKRHRNAATALLMQRAIISDLKEGVLDFVYGSPNKAAEPILKRVSFQLLGSQVGLFLVLKTVPYISEKLRAWYKKNELKTRISALIASFLSELKKGYYRIPSLQVILEQIGKMFSKKNETQQGHLFQTREVADFDHQFDLFWKHADLSNRFIGERSAEFLRFRFTNTPQGEHKILALFCEEQIKGYIVYRQIERAIEIRDFLFGCDAFGTDFLIQAFLQSARHSSATVITLLLLENAAMMAPFKSAGFVEGQHHAPTYLYVSDRMRSLFPSMMNKTEWLLLQSDNDI